MRFKEFDQPFLMSTIWNTLRDREIGIVKRSNASVVASKGHHSLLLERLPKNIYSKLNTDCGGALQHLNSLKASLTSQSWHQIENDVSDVLSTLLEKLVNFKYVYSALINKCFQYSVLLIGLLMRFFR